MPSFFLEVINTSVFSWSALNPITSEWRAWWRYTDTFGVPQFVMGQPEVQSGDGIATFDISDAMWELGAEVGWFQIDSRVRLVGAWENYVTSVITTVLPGDIWTWNEALEQWAPPGLLHQIKNIRTQYNGGADTPIKLLPGDPIKVTGFWFEHKGDAGSLYFCFAARKGATNFNNGEDIVGGPSYFASMPLDVLGDRDWNEYFKPASLELLPDLARGFVPDREYDTYTWIAVAPTSQESEIRGIDTDANVFKVLSAIEEIHKFNILKIERK